MQARKIRENGFLFLFFLIFLFNVCFAKQIEDSVDMNMAMQNLGKNTL